MDRTDSPVRPLRRRRESQTTRANRQHPRRIPHVKPEDRTGRALRSPQLGYRPPRPAIRDAGCTTPCRTPTRLEDPKATRPRPVLAVATPVATSRPMRLVRPANRPIWTIWTPMEASTRPLHVEGLVDFMVRGGSSPLGRTGQAPEERGFLLVPGHFHMPSAVVVVVARFL
jgi:hypothetical protein